MKKNTTKSDVRAKRKAVRKDMETKLATQLQEVIGNLGITSKKTGKEINKIAKRLAKKFSEKLNVEKEPVVPAKKKNTAVSAPASSELSAEVAQDQKETPAKVTARRSSVTKKTESNLAGIKRGRPVKQEQAEIQAP